MHICMLHVKKSRVKKVDVSMVYLPHQQQVYICLVDVFVKRPKPYTYRRYSFDTVLSFSLQFSIPYK